MAKSELLQKYISLKIPRDLRFWPWLNLHIIYPSFGQVFDVASPVFLEILLLGSVFMYLSVSRANFIIFLLFPFVLLSY